MPVAVRQLSASTKFGIAAAVVLLRLYILTLRVRLSPTAKEFLAHSPRSSLFLIWHNRFMLALCSFARTCKTLPLTTLVSASSDGAMSAEVMHAFGLQTARGSSSKRAVEATRELVAALDAGRNVVITPDGPRGPIYTVKDGTARIGQSHAKAIYLVGLHCRTIWQLKSWDKFMIPKPFSLVELDVEKLCCGAESDVQLLQSKLMKVNGERVPLAATV